MAGPIILSLPKVLMRGWHYASLMSDLSRIFPAKIFLVVFAPTTECKSSTGIPVPGRKAISMFCSMMQSCGISFAATKLLPAHCLLRCSLPATIFAVSKLPLADSIPRTSDTKFLSWLGLQAPKRSCPSWQSSGTICFSMTCAPRATGASAIADPSV